MITEEEFDNIQIGDYIQIVDKWNDFTRENSDGNMDYLLGQIFEVTNEATTTTVEKNDTYYNLKIIKMNSEYDYWYLNMSCIEKVIKCNHYEKEIIRLNQEIKKLKNDNEELKQKILKYEKIIKPCFQCKGKNSMRW